MTVAVPPETVTVHRFELGWTRPKLRTPRLGMGRVVPHVRALLAALTARLPEQGTNRAHRRARRSRYANALGLALPVVGLAGLTSIWWALILAGPLVLIWDLTAD